MQVLRHLIQPGPLFHPAPGQVQQGGFKKLHEFSVVDRVHRGERLVKPDAVQEVERYTEMAEGLRKPEIEKVQLAQPVLALRPLILESFGPSKSILALLEGKRSLTQKPGIHQE